jgi:hypothetical protein
MTKPKPDAIESLRQLLAREAWSGRDAVFAAAIIEIADRVDALARLDVAVSGKVEALEELYHVLSDSVGALAFLSKLLDERVDADANADADARVM